MALLTVEGFEVPVLPGTAINDVRHGDRGRAYSGKVRSDFNATHRTGRIVASIFDTANDAGALRAILKSPGPVTLGGTLIGDDASFHVSNLVVSPITVDRLKFDFDVTETDDSPTELLFSFDGDAPGTNTFTRSGAVGKYVDSAGVLQDAAADVFRRPWIYTGSPVNGTLPDTQTGLVEFARTNLISDDDLTAWTATNAPTVTGSVDDPAGGTGAYSIEDDSGLTEYIDSPAVAASTPDSAVFVVRENVHPATGATSLVVRDTTAGVDRLVLAINSWTNGAPNVTANTGTLLGTRYVGAGYWAIYGQGTGVTSNTHLARILPANQASETGTIDVYRVNMYDQADPLWSIVDASETKNADTWYGTYTPLPQELTVYVKMIEAGSVRDAVDGGIVHIGGASAAGDPRFVLQAAGGFYQANHDNGTTNPIATLAAAPSWGDTVELRAVLNADGSVDIGQSINSAAETTATDATTATLGAAWNDTQLYLGSLGTSGHGVNPIISVKVVSGVRTMAEMRDWARGRLWPRQS